MKSVLFINYEYPPVGGGAANANYNLALTLAACGLHTSVLTSAYMDRRGHASENGVSVYRIPAFRKYAGRASLLQMFAYLMSALVHLPAVIGSEKPDITIPFFTFPCGPAAFFCKVRWKIPYILMLRGGDVPGFVPDVKILHFLLMPLRRIVYRRSRHIVANSAALRDLALKADPGFNMEIIENGVDTQFFVPQLNGNIKSDDFIFMFAGRLCEQKNIWVLLKAFAACKHECGGIRLVIIGEGPLLRSLKTFAARLHIEKKVEWIGWQSKENLRGFLQSAQCFVSPSVSEGMSNAVLEAMACGLPVIAGDCAGNRELVNNGENGFLVAPENVDGLREKMMYCVNHRTGCRELGNAGRVRCCEQFSWKAAAGKLINLIEAGGE